MVEGRRFGKLIVVMALPRMGNNRKVVCRCDCGTETTVFESSLVAARTTSCGCWRSQKAAILHTTHGESGNAYKKRPLTPEYRTWKQMKERCINPANKRYPRYGGRGIQVCEHWAGSFETFLNDMGRRPTPQHQIDRKDNDGNYEPSNCRWATRGEQQANTSRSRFVVLDGNRMTITAAARSLGVHRATAEKRLLG